MNYLEYKFIYSFSVIIYEPYIVHIIYYIIYNNLNYILQD